VSDWPWDGITLPQPKIPVAETFEGFLGLKWEELTAGTAKASFELRNNLRQPAGLLHGGIYSAVAETVASVATVASVWRDELSVAGLSNSASFLRPAIEGTVHVTAVCRHHDDLEWFW